MDKSFVTGCYIWQKHASTCRRCSSDTKNWHVHGGQDASMCSTGSTIPKIDPIYQKITSNKSKNKDMRTFKKNGKRTRNKRKRLPPLDSRWITEPPKIADILQVSSLIQCVVDAQQPPWHVHDVEDASRCSTCLKIPESNPLYQKIHWDKSKKTGVRSFMKNRKRKKNKRKKLPCLDSRCINEPPKIADILNIKLTRIQIVRRNRKRKGLDRSAKMERKNNPLSNTAAKSDHIVDRFTKRKKNRRNYSKKHEKYLKF